MTRYRIIVAPSAQRDLGRLPEKIATAIIEFMTGPLAEDPHRVGKPLDAPFEPLWVARRGEYRVIYGIDHDVIEVEVVYVAHRRDAYRPR